MDVVHNVQLKLETTNTSRHNVELYWDPPTTPNGFVVSYTIQYTSLAQDSVDEKKCILSNVNSNATVKYILQGLSSGNYSFQIRANSLAGYGNFTEPYYLYIPVMTKFCFWFYFITNFVFQYICTAIQNK